MNKSIQSYLLIFSFLLISTLAFAQAKVEKPENPIIEYDFSDRKAILKTVENFYIGDHTGSVEHKKLSMHEKGAYRFINRSGEYGESIFDLNSDHGDVNYKEELLSIEIYSRMSVVKVRLDPFKSDVPEYKTMILHKGNDGWKITSITWGFGITQ